MDDLNNFKRALKFVLKWEGGYVNNKYDKGGATNKGITQNTYNAWLKNLGLSSRDVKNITQDEVEQIYYKNYWIRCGCQNMSAKFAILAFDTAVNMGIARVNQFMKAAQWKYPEKFIAAREAKYREFAKYGNQHIFLQGWLNRLYDLKKFIQTV